MAWRFSNNYRKIDAALGTQATELNTVVSNDGKNTSADWQTKLAEFANEKIGLVGFILDLNGNIAAQANFFLALKEEPNTPVEDDNLQAQARAPFYRSSMSKEVSYQMRQLDIAGEVYMVRTNQGFYSLPVNAKGEDRKGITRFQLRREKDKSYIDVQTGEWFRTYYGDDSFREEANSPLRRIIPTLETYEEVLLSIKKLAKSNTAVPKMVWFGKNRGISKPKIGAPQSGSDIRTAENPTNQALEGFNILARQMMEGERFAPAYGVVSEEAPQVIDLSTEISKDYVDVLEKIEGIAANGVSVPSALARSDPQNHFQAWLQNNQLKEWSVEPKLNIVLDGMSDYILPLLGIDPNVYRYGFRFDTSSYTAADATVALQAYAMKLVNQDYVLRVLQAMPEDAWDYIPTAEDLDDMTGGLLSAVPSPGALGDPTRLASPPASV